MFLILIACVVALNEGFAQAGAEASKAKLSTSSHNKGSSGLRSSRGDKHQTGSPASYQIPSAATIVALVRNSLNSVNDANLTGNYSVLSQLCSPDAKKISPPEVLAESFRAIREQKTDFSIISAATPNFTQLPMITPQGLLRLKGHFQSVPVVTFDIFFQRVGLNWKIYAIGVGVLPVDDASRTARSAELKGKT